MKAKEEKDFTILTHKGLKYKISYDLLALNDYYIDFPLYHIDGINAVDKCTSPKMLELINNHYSVTEPIKRLSSKIVATDDPKLIKDGVPQL